MEILSSPTAVQAWSDAQRAAGRRVGFVPTMGALHDGHLALVADAAARTDVVVVSIFVNPLQFNEAADFAGYPRPIDDDVEACRRAGVAAVYAPTAATIYPAGFQTRVLPGPLGEVMEGPHRPGHFEGVVTIVAKLFGAVRPHVAVFGQKDYQQLRIITQMAADLDLGVEVVGHPIVRDDDGLAKSSRNIRLSPQQRAAAVVVPRALDAAVAIAAQRPAGTVNEIVDAALAELANEPAATVEYVTIFDADTLVEIDDLAAHRQGSGAIRIATAVWFGEIRLIDNCDLDR